jgi:hypothetical protein
MWLKTITVIGMLSLLPACGGNGEPKKTPLSELPKVLAHQKKRFDDLETILKKDAKYRLRFPGQNAQVHYLGSGIAKGQWPAAEHAEMTKYISDRIKKLEKDFPGRISFGLIGDYKFVGPDCDRNLPNTTGVPGAQNDGTFVIHIWGANAGNFNQAPGTTGSFGSGQASCFSSQRPGVFGISTMQGGDEAVLMATDKLLALY